VGCRPSPRRSDRGSSSGTARRTCKMSGMVNTASGIFDVTMQPGPAELDGAISRFELSKTFRGDLQGTGAGVMLSGGDLQAGAAGYVAIERGPQPRRAAGQLRVAAVRVAARRVADVALRGGAGLRQRPAGRAYRHPAPQHRRGWRPPLRTRNTSCSSVMPLRKTIPVRAKLCRRAAVHDSTEIVTATRSSCDARF